MKLPGNFPLLLSLFLSMLFASFYVSCFFVCCLLFVTRLSSVELRVEALVRVSFQQHNNKVLFPLLEGINMCIYTQDLREIKSGDFGDRDQQDRWSHPSLRGLRQRKTKKNAWVDILKKIFFVFFWL